MNRFVAVFYILWLAFACSIVVLLNGVDKGFELTRDVFKDVESMLS